MASPEANLQARRERPQQGRVKAQEIAESKRGCSNEGLCRSASTLKQELVSEGGAASWIRQRHHSSLSLMLYGSLSALSRIIARECVDRVWLGYGARAAAVAASSSSASYLKQLLLWLLGGPPLGLLEQRVMHSYSVSLDTPH